MAILADSPGDFLGLLIRTGFQSSCTSPNPGMPNPPNKQHCAVLNARDGFKERYKWT